MKLNITLIFFLFILTSCLTSNNNEPKDEESLENTLVDTATIHEDLISFSPNHNQENVSLNTEIKLEFKSGVSISGTVYLELFGVENSKTNCRIDWGGFTCGDLSIEDSYYELFNAPPKPNDGVVDPANLNDAEIVFGTAVISNDKSVIINPQRNLLPGITYVVHIYTLGNDGNFKTWWVFKT